MYAVSVNKCQKSFEYIKNVNQMLVLFQYRGLGKIQIMALTRARNLATYFHTIFSLTTVSYTQEIFPIFPIFV